MIRGINISSPFFNANCPAETKELNCVRPYCPFFHINKPNHFNIAEIKKKVSSTPLNLAESEIFVPETPPHKLSNEYDRLNKSRATIQQENVVMDDGQFGVGGYVGYVAQDQGIESGMEQNNMSMGMSNQSSSSSQPFYPATMMQSPAYAMYHPAYSHTPTFRSNQFPGTPYPTTEPITPQITGYQSHGFSSCPTFSIQQPQDYHRPHNSSNHHLGRDEKRAKKEMPSYTPTPIVQLERENEAREKRRELIERQKRIRERLEGQKEEALKQQSKAKKESNGGVGGIKKNLAAPAESFPIDQILADQAELLAEHESNKVELEKRRQREKHKEQVEKCRKRKGFVSNDDEKESKNKKSNNQTVEAMAENESPEWIRKRSSEEMMDEFGEEAAKWKAKTEDQMGRGSSCDDREDADEEARNAIKMIRMAKQKQEEEEKIAMMKRMKKNREKPKTVIDELIKAEKMKKEKEEEKSSKKKKKGAEKQEKEMTASPEKKTATQVNDCLKNVAQIDKSIEDLEKQIRRSTNKLAHLPHVSMASSSSGKKENGSEKNKFLPIWRRPEKMKNALTNVLEDNLFNRAHQKSNESLIEKIFGKDDETKTVNEEKSKQENKKKKKERPIWEEQNGAEKRRRSSSGSGKEEQRKMAKRIKEKEAEMIRQEQQKLVDLISDEEEEDEKTTMKNDSNDEDICFLAVVNKSGNVENNNLALSTSCIAKPEIMVVEESAKKSTDETQSTSNSNPIAPSNANPNSNIRPHSPAHSTASSVSVVPESPLSSPQRPAEIAEEKKKQESVIPIKNNRPAQIPSAQEQLHNRTLQAMLKIADEQQNQEGRKDLTSIKKVKEEKASTTSEHREISANLIKQEGQKSRNSLQLSTPSPRIASSSTMTPSSSSMPVPSAKRPLPTTSVLPFKRESLAKYKPSVLQQQTLAASLKKGEQRKAHVPKFEILNAALKRQLIPLEPGNRKVSLQIRQARLALIHAEYVKICWDQPDLAIESAQQEEKAILDKCSTRMGYVSAIPNVIKRLREAAAENRGNGKERKNSVSHKNVLLGRHAESVTLGLNRAQRVAEHKATHLSESDFYEALADEYLLTEEELWTNGYPRWVENGEEEEEFEPGEINSDTGYSIAERSELPKRRCVEIRQSELETSKGRGQKQFVSDKELKRVCSRCGVEYLLTKDGNYAPGISSEDCIYHWGRAWKKRTHGTVDTRYTCCDSPAGDRGCVVATRHITQSLRMSTLAKYVESPRPFGVGDPRSKKVYALDCEMIYCVWGPEVARISMVDVLGELVLDEFVRPEFALVDCNTKFSGLTEEQINNAPNDLKKAQERLFELVNSETILIGHSLESDLRALRIVHKRVVDTSVVFPHRLGPPQKRALKTLATELLQLIIQEDETGHDSKEDALACMRIMLKKVRGGGAE